MATYQENQLRAQLTGLGAPARTAAKPAIQNPYLKRLFKGTALEDPFSAPDASRYSADIYGTGDGPPNFAGPDPNVPVIQQPSFANVQAGVTQGVPNLPVIQNPAFGNVQGGGISTAAPALNTINGRPLGRAVATAPQPPQIIAPVPQPPQGPVNGIRNPSEALRMQESDLASIATGDFRSVAGRAAQAARSSVQNYSPSRIGTTRKQREAMTNANAEQAAATINALTAAAIERPKLAQAATSEDNRLRAEQARESGDTQRALIGADAQVASARIQRPRNPQSVTLADGTLAQIGDDATATIVTGPDGKPITPRTGKAPVDQAAFAKVYSDNYTRALTAMGVDPISGMIVDPNDPKKSRAPTGVELQRATAAARTLTNEALSGADSAAAPTAAPTQAQFMAEAKKANPGVSDADLEAYYKQNYGG